MNPAERHLKAQYEKKLASGFDWLKNNWIRKGFNNIALASYKKEIRLGHATKEDIRKSAEAWIKQVNCGRLKLEFMPTLESWLSKQQYKNSPSISRMPLEEIEKREREWESEKKKLNKTPRWAGALVRRDFKTVKGLSELAKKHLALNGQYVRAMIDAGASSDDLWIMFWYSPCFRGLKPEEKTKESFEKFLKEC